MGKRVRERERIKRAAKEMRVNKMTENTDERNKSQLWDSLRAIP